MNHRVSASEKVIQSINWQKIKSYHKNNNILWEIEDDKVTHKRLPSVAELRDELRSIFAHMISEDLHYISYGSWIIFWEREDDNAGDIRVIFRLAEFVFEEDTKSKQALEKALAKAVESEDYENAAVLRDALVKKEKSI